MPLFDRCVGAVLARLYESFPDRITIDFLRDVPKDLFDDSDTEDDCWQKFTIMEPTVRWLEQAGYLWTGGISGSTVTEVVLTPKALEVMKAVPARLATKQTLGEFLSESVKSGAKQKVQEGVEIALTEGGKLLWWLGQNALNKTDF